MLTSEPRDYQQKIFETAREKNTLVVLPTGLGKTLIALMLTIDRLKKHPGSKILLLAPTRPLVEQHFAYFTEQLPELFAEFQLFTGEVPKEKRQKIWQTAEVIFSTPQCIANDLKKYLYDTSEVSLLIIDEAHRCLKNYDYTTVVDFYKRQSQHQRVLGLTASPGSDPEIVKQICTHLNIEEIELRSRFSEDVKSYLQELEFTKREVPFPPEFIELRVLLRRIWDSQINQLKSRNILQGPANKITLLKLQARLAAQLSSKNFYAMIGMSLTAQAIKISHAIELLETQTLFGLHEYFKTLQKQAEDKKSKAVQKLVASPDFNAAYISLQYLLAKKVEHPKIEELALITQQEFSSNPQAKIIIFTQFRDTASTIVSRLSQIPHAKPAVFIGQTKKTSSKGTVSGLNQKDQKQVIEQFKSGEINLLVATSIGEEGLDIPEVHAVIFYEPVPSAIRKIQRAGRTARLAPGKLMILVTKDTRDEINHWASAAREKRMYHTIEDVQKEIKEQQKNPTLDKFR